MWKLHCIVGRQQEKRREDDRLQQFLLGLYSKYYAQTRSNICVLRPSPYIE